MKRIYWLIGATLVITLSGILVWSKVTVAEANEKLPYHASSFEAVTWEGPHADCGPDRILVDVQGGGQATHLGEYTVERQHCFNPASATFEEGTFKQTAANGDQVWGTYEGFTEQVLEFADDGSPAVIVINAPWQITGGTGRFVNADGEGSTRGVFNLVSHEGDFEMEGWMSYSASDGQ